MTTAIKVGVLSCATAIALFFAYWGFGVATKVFDDNKDNTDSAYLFIGGPLLAFGLGVLGLTLVVGLPLHMSRGELLLSVPIAVVLGAGVLAYFYYGLPTEPPGPDYHRSLPMNTMAPGTGPGLATPSIGTPLPQR